MGCDSTLGPPRKDPPASSRKAAWGLRTWSEALQEARWSLEKEGRNPRGRVRERAQKIVKQWRTGKEAFDQAFDQAFDWQGRPAEEDAVLGHPPNDPPASSRNAPRGRSPSQMWLPKLRQKKEKEGRHPRGRVRGRAQHIKEQCTTGSKDRNVKQRTE